MISDHNPNPQPPGGINALVRCNPVVDRDQQVRHRIVRFEPVDNTGREAVTVRETAWHPKIQIPCTHHLKPQHGDRRTGCAVSIKVTENQNFLLLFNGVSDQFNCAINPPQVER